MSAGTYISRVGALAVALGVGGLLGGAATAWADDDADPATKATASSGPRANGAAAPRHAPSAAAASRQRSTASGQTLSAAPTRVVVAVDRPSRIPRPRPAVTPLPDLVAAVGELVRRELGEAPTAAPGNQQQALAQSPNLLVNGDAEAGDASPTGYFGATVPGWQLAGLPTVIEYGTPRRFPSPLATPGPVLPGFLAFPATPAGSTPGNNQFFGGGPVATSSLSQTVNFNGTNVDGVSYTLSGDLGGFTIDPSATSVAVQFLDSSGTVLGSGKLNQVTALERWLQTGFIHRSTTGTIPVGTVSAQVLVTFTDRNPILGNYNNAYLDNLSFTVADPTLSPAVLTPPASNVGHLDHVYVIYMENKGYTDIVGSPNAPYFNLLIDNYGFANNYYALTHPSDQNYTAALGGGDFGVNWNCPQNCFDKDNLANSVENSPAGLNWAGYAENGVGYNIEDPGVLPFLAFKDIYNDPYRVATHLFDLTQLSDDLNGTDPANFVWIAADDATNMEGPISGLGVLQWVVSQLTPPALGGHQYNVAAGDTWLQDTVGTIFTSASWQDPGQASAIFITFDEDYNNLSLGNGNQGNHVVMVAIPSPGAVGTNAGQMIGGPVVATDHYNHYSLMRTIELALGLGALTNNELYAQPMNEFWNA